MVENASTSGMRTGSWRVPHLLFSIILCCLCLKGQQIGHSRPAGRIAEILVILAVDPEAVGFVGFKLYLYGAGAEGGVVVRIADKVRLGILPC